MKRHHSCKRVAELLSQRLDEPLGLLDTIRLRVHMAICSNCRHVKTQLEAVESLTAVLFEADTRIEDEAKAPMAHGQGDHRGDRRAD